MTIADRAEGRDNNFNLVRIAAALLVVVAHSFALALGDGSDDLTTSLLGLPMGSFAVDVFFLTSGFLITTSLFRRQSAVEFFWARVLRIYPALLVMLVFTAFGVGIAFTTLPLPAYLADGGLWRYLARGASLLFGVDMTLPGVFEHNPHWATVNGSLWTLPWEMRMYAILGLTWVLLGLVKQRRLAALRAVVLILALGAGTLTFVQHFLGHLDSPGIRLTFLFFTGGAVTFFKDRIPLSWTGFGVGLALVLVSAFQKDVFFVVYTLLIPYLTFCFAYLPQGKILRYNKLGDYSYGVYIYSFPIQQSLVALFPGISTVQLFLSSTPLVLLASVASWHGIESKALSLKGTLVGRVSRLLGRSA